MSTFNVDVYFSLSWVETFQVGAENEDEAIELVDRRLGTDEWRPTRNNPLDGELEWETSYAEEVNE